MPPTNIADDAFLELKNLATWVYKTAEMGEEKGEKNLSRCMDKEAREAKVRPLLEKLGYDKIQGHLVGLLRIYGSSSIEKPDNYRSLLFFPLSIGSGPESIVSGEVQVAGEVLKPGTYIQLTSTLNLDAQLDCLIVLLP
ncbi:hypothetical protein PENARI_c063G04804 [Penicillium arizonense]|uniref:Uncharacterized protein n=1 Tax=Penicillium arizonense TaxID=1835702 RepID=A0A1F5L1K3_PENAI|nr:hypothetical protein PENARI_c063G04804 [Penicillium arizonense]OGE47103.1 hypothetical protein PENARI_c063G04804 [Penicillium arizonense]